MQPLSLATSILIVSTALMAQPTEPMPIKKEGVGYIKMLGKALKSELEKHLKADPSGLEALAFCSGSAGNITKEVNAKLPAYAKVRRTALRVRNDKTNTSDATDKQIMEKFEHEIAKKQLDDKTIEVVKVGDTTRIYKPLVTKPVCLKCHGSDLAPKIAEAIKSAYPQDKAIGFKEGELRGVIVAEIKDH